MDEDTSHTTRWMRMMQCTVTPSEFQERRATGNCFRCSIRHNPAHQCRPTVVNSDIMAHLRIPLEANNDEDAKQNIAFKLRERGINEAPQLYLSSSLVIAIREDTFVMMAANSLMSRNGVPYAHCRQRIVNIGPSVVAAGTGNSMLIETAMDSIGEAGPQKKIADVNTMRGVADICAEVINRRFGSLNLNPSVKEDVVMFMLVGFVGQTNDTLVIIQDDVTKKFIVREPEDRRICCIGSGDESVTNYMQDNPLPDQWTVEEAKHYCVSCLAGVFEATNSCGGDIRIRTITAAGVEDDGDEERYIKQDIGPWHMQYKSTVFHKWFDSSILISKVLRLAMVFVVLTWSTIQE